MHCKVDDCSKRAAARGFCRSHYHRWLRHGDPNAGRTKDGEPFRYLKAVVLSYEGNDCLTWPYGRSANGYGHINRSGVHRLVCMEANGPPPTPEHLATHSCGKGHEGCVTKAHLSWKTRVGNEADKKLHGTHNKRGRYKMADLTTDDISNIRSLKGKKYQREVAKQYGISRKMVEQIQRFVSERKILS